MQNQIHFGVDQGPPFIHELASGTAEFKYTVIHINCTCFVIFALIKPQIKRDEFFNSQHNFFQELDLTNGVLTRAMQGMRKLKMTDTLKHMKD